MGRTIFENQNFENIAIESGGLPEGAYEQCTFRHCQLVEANLSHRIFSECIFKDCDLSGAKMGDTAFKDVSFEHCKLLGIDFSHCNNFLLEMRFDHCMLNLASFYRLNLKGTAFVHCSMQEADFVETNLSESVFVHCDLSLTQFDQTNLEKADMRQATNYSIHPSNNRIKKAKFSREGIVGLLDAFDLTIE